MGRSKGSDVTLLFRDQGSSTRVSIRPSRAVDAPVLTAIVLSLLVSACAQSEVTPGASPSVDEHHHGGGEGEPSREPTEAERAAAGRLVSDTRAAMAASYEDPQVARRAGYVQFMPYAFGEIPAAHFFNVEAIQDGRDLDPEHPESLIYLRRADGELTLLGVMFISGDRGDPIGGPLTQWHTHPEGCMVRAAIVPRLATGDCPRGGRPIVAQMLHVWTVENPDGPFAHTLSAEATAEVTGQTREDLPIVPVVDETTLRRALAEALQLSDEDIRSRFEGGETLLEMATAQGVSREDLVTALQSAFAANTRRALENDEVSRKLARALDRWFAQQAPLLTEIGTDDPPGAETPGASETDFGYPCERITCLIPGGE